MQRPHLGKVAIHDINIYVVPIYFSCKHIKFDYISRLVSGNARHHRCSGHTFVHITVYIFVSYEEAPYKG